MRRPLDYFNLNLWYELFESRFLRHKCPNPCNITKNAWFCVKHGNLYDSFFKKPTLIQYINILLFLLNKYLFWNWHKLFLCWVFLSYMAQPLIWSKPWLKSITIKSVILAWARIYLYCCFCWSSLKCRNIPMKRSR